MRWTNHLTLSSCLLLFFTACAHAPHALNDDQRAEQTRSEFVQTHPQGKYNEFISRGEVVRGMDVLEVSASWGVPETRRLSKDRKLEYWTYFGKDEISGDWSRYTLVFERRTLTDWQVDRHFIKNGTLTQWTIPGDSEPLRNPTANASATDSAKR
jgi:hypothetical protein